MIDFLARRSAPQPRLLSERGQGVALLVFGVAVLFLICALAKGRFG